MMRTELHICAGVFGDDLSMRWCGFNGTLNEIWTSHE